MVRYPVHVPRDGYRGSDPRRRKKLQNWNRAAQCIEEYINREVATWEEDTAYAIMSYQVASAIGEDDQLVHQIICRMDGGSNGVTVWKGDYERAVSGKTRSKETNAGNRPSQRERSCTGYMQRGSALLPAP